MICTYFSISFLCENHCESLERIVLRGPGLALSIKFYKMQLVLCPCPALYPSAKCIPSQCRGYLANHIVDVYMSRRGGQQRKEKGTKKVPFQKNNCFQKKTGLNVFQGDLRSLAFALAYGAFYWQQQRMDNSLVGQLCGLALVGSLSPGTQPQWAL